VAGAGAVAMTLVAGLDSVVVAGGAGVVVVATAVAARIRRRRRAQECRRETIAFAHAAAGEIRAGRTAAEALAAAAGQLPQLRAVLASAVHAVRAGAPLETALLDAVAGGGAVADVGRQRVAVVAAVWGLGAETGARVADTLEAVAAAFAAEDEHAEEMDAAAAGPRATVLLLAVLPLGGLLVGSAMGTSPLQVLLHTRLGTLLMGAAAVLDLVGVVWMRRLTALRRPP
jgi:tight adherence protein B